ncbi:MAG: MmcQ/YjbR family DNA-binding protein [Aeromicrobium sp.]
MVDVPPELLDRVRSICLGLPETYEERAWVGVRWRVRQRTFAHLFTLGADSSSVLRGSFDLEGEATAVTFRVPADELRALSAAGPPFHYAGWGRDVMGMHLDATTDWVEVAEVLTDSYCLLAPQKLVARVDRPSDVND